MWLEATGDARVWSSPKETHKMGWLRAGDQIQVAEGYQGWYRFESYVGGDDLVPLDASYTEYWTHSGGPLAEVDTPDPEPEPPPPPPAPTGTTDEEVGAALRTLLTFLRDIFRE